MQKIRRGSGFRGVLSYLLDHDEPEIIAGTISAGSVRDMTREFVALSQTRSDIKKPVWHNSLRLPAGEGLSSDKWSEIAGDYMREIGMESAQWIAIKHNHSDGEHIHIVANRVQPEGSIYLGKNENLKSTRIIQQLEKDYNLAMTKGPDLDNGKIVMPDKLKPSKNEIDKALRLEEAPTRLLLQTVIDGVLAENPSMHDFADRLSMAGVIIRPNIASTGRVNGLAFELDGLTFSGSKLGKKYSWSHLQSQLGYKPDRHNALLQKLKAQAQINDKNTASTEANRTAEPAIQTTYKNDERAGTGNRQDDRQVKQVSKSTPNGSSNTEQRNNKTQKTIGSNVRSSNAASANAYRNSDNKINYPYPHPHKSKGETMNTIQVEELDEARKKRKKREQELFIITRKKKRDAETDSKTDAKKKRLENPEFKLTVDLAFTKQGNEYYRNSNNKLAFREEEDRVVCIAPNFDETIVKAMVQAAQRKFGDEFEASGSEKYRRESWFQTSMIGCLNHGYEPKSEDFEELKRRLVQHADKYGRELDLHPLVADQLEKHEQELEQLRQHMLSPGQQPAAKSVNGVAGLKDNINSWRAQRERQQSANDYKQNKSNHSKLT